MISCREEEIKAYLVLNRLRIDGRRRAVELLSEGKTAREVIERMESEDLLNELSAPAGMPPFNADKEIALCVQKGICFLTFSDADYPSALKGIPDPPLLLYKKGTLTESDRNAVAIVGTRHPSFYGRTQAKRFAQDLAAKGLTIVSGLARGIDQIAHEAALQVSYGRTIAVMGCGLDVIYPREHEQLFGRIAERGAVLSEYPLGTPPLPENFPRRNRILSGLSYATFVAEAHSRSGSLITAHQAVEQGREVFALPGPVDQLTSRGTHQLLKEGAMLVEAPEDILLALADRLKWENKFETANEASVLSVSPQGVQTVVKNLISILPFRHSPADGKPSDSMPEKELEKTGDSHLLGDRQETGEVENETLPPVDVPEEEEDVVLQVLKEEGALTQDEILEFTGLDPSQLPGRLLQLELMKKIRKAQDGRYSLPG